MVITSFKCIPILVCILFFSSNIFAQEIGFDSVTTTSTISPLNQHSTGRNIIIVKADHFAKFPVQSLDELLRYLPGIEVQSRGPMGTQSDILMRGGSFQQVLVAIDGIKVNDPTSGHLSAYIPIALAEIERIEILKGGATAMYGPEAVGGVINIITKTFSTTSDANKKRIINVQASGGQNGLFSCQVGGFIQDQYFAAGGGFLSNNASGQINRGVNNYFYNHTGSASIRYFINENWNFAVRTSADLRNISARNFYSLSKPDSASDYVTNYWNQVKVEFSKNKHHLTFHAGFKNTTDEYRINDMTARNINKSRHWQGQILYKHEYSNNTTIIAGTQFIYREINSNNLGTHQLNQVGAFIQANHRIGEHINLFPSLRLEKNFLNAWEGVPQINMSYRTSKAQFRISGGKTLRNPDFTELYGNTKRPRTLIGLIGNEDLSPEQSYGFEGGVDFFGIQGLKISGTFFAKYYSRMIEYVKTAYADIPRRDNLVPTGIYSLAKNQSNVSTAGVETDIQFSKIFANKHNVFATLGITSIASNSDKRQTSPYSSYHANFLANFNIQYKYKKLSMGINGLYKERKKEQAFDIDAELAPNYFVMNVFAEAMVYNENISVFAQGNNIFNKQYSDILGAVMPGVWVMGGVKLSL